ncbi:cytochrome P450 CYP72A219-like isoform X1 [Iris pallida]|uniref:Cytochrome P450 CYP72A219-like isoform X1 n=1 Tax=Iris pallida TaxID=29817 RepID=A0AAX6G8N4_IRIPA|nr:cytochrome P450 CYP72A219-like isoform X1 [Iris pallida]
MLFSCLVLVPVLSYFLARAYCLLWRKPKALEKLLRRQGFEGNNYRFFYGDAKEEKEAFVDAWSRPMDTHTHGILPRVSPFLHRTLERYGKNSFSWSGAVPRIVIWDLEIAREILQNKSGHIRKPPPNPLTRSLATGVANLQGEELAKRRKIIIPAFRLEKLKEMVPDTLTSCQDLIKRWDELARRSEGSCELDVWVEFDNLTGDIISRTAFGSSFEEGKRIFQLQKEQAVLLVEAATSPYIPGLRFMPTAKNKKRKQLDEEIKSILRAIINRKLKLMESEESDCSDLLGLLLQLTKDHDKDGITVADVIEECKLFYFAGQETTSTLLTWTLVLLSMHPTWQQKAREEVLNTCGGNAPGFESLTQFRVVSMILYEVLRLYSPATSLSRRTFEECKLGEYIFPAGVDLVVPIAWMHHDPEFWGDDAEVFNPERFSEGVSKATKEGRNAFYPFGWGQRMCLGQNFAIMEAKVALALILQNFSFELSPYYVHAPCKVITLQPQHGAHVILRRL